MKNQKRSTTTRLIGAFKLLKCIVLVAVSVGALELLHHDVAERTWHVIRQLHLDPERGWVMHLLRRLNGVHDHQLHEVTIATFVYATLFGIEGVGLLMDKRWAHWFTVIVTGSFVPFETYEMIKHFTILRLFALILNVAIVAYLVVRIVRESRGSSSKRERRSIHPGRAMRHSMSSP